MLQIAFLTGQSNPACWALSPVQAAFLAQLQRGNRQLHGCNFPYQPESPSHEPVPLLKASVHNSAQYLLSRRPSFSERYQAAVLALLSRHPHTVLLTGSCGLELLNNLRLPPAWLSRVSVFAFGPVARHSPDCRHVLVQGRLDGISRLFFNTVHHLVECGHMDYLQQEAVLALCESFLDQVAASEFHRVTPLEDGLCG
jgi:hypothetical protein